MIKYKQILHKDYLTIQIPEDWVYDDSKDEVSIYSNDGVGAITISFLSLMTDNRNELETFMSKTLVDVARQIKIKIDGAFIMNTSNPNKGVIYAQGKTEDGCYWKLWLMAKWPRFIIATYNCEQKKSKELKQIDAIMDSVVFLGE